MDWAMTRMARPRRDAVLKIAHIPLKSLSAVSKHESL
jgi:hypothetical protein